jgi:hypothetical protein
VHKDIKHCIQQLKGISERIALLKMATDKISTTVIQVYAPTESSPEEAIEAFYEDLERTLTIHRTQRVFILGDFNCKVGARNEEEAPVGPSGIGTRLIQFTEEHNLFILNTFVGIALSLGSPIVGITLSPSQVVPKSEEITTI